MTVIHIEFLNYGIKIQCKKAEKDYNPKSKKYNSDGSLPKYRVYGYWGKYINPYCVFSFLYNYSLVFRLLLNRG